MDRLGEEVGDFLLPSSSFHQSVPDLKPDTFGFPPHLMVPKAQHFDALYSQEMVPICVAGTLVRKSVPATVYLHREARRDTKEIEEVNAAGILAPELEVGEATVAK